MDRLIEGLNPQQCEAVMHTEGPLLIVAGAGSGKTRVIVHRLAYILAHRLAEPHEVVAVTFTNKAAGEMKDRVDRLVGADHGGAHVSTFHSWCLRLLRRHASVLGYGTDFQVYDDTDQKALIKECLADLQIDDTSFPPRMLRHRISDAKNRGLSPAAFERDRGGFQDGITARVYTLYQERLRSCNAMDFDDLIGCALELLTSHEDAARDEVSRVRYLMVDEYQDTNPPQYRLIRALSAVHGNVCAVGDPDQSIYRFRFADINNILSFERDFPGTRVIKLEQNYRSTSNILEAATAVIRNNYNRIEKSLWCEASSGEPVLLLVAADERHEADRVIQRIGELRHDHDLEEFAILYRTNAQSRSFEETLARAGLPYLIVGGTRFYDRREVKDLVAYIRVLLNPRDDVSLRRIINVPPRDIGKTTLETVSGVAHKAGCPLEEAIRRTLDLDLVGTRAARALRGFLELVSGLRSETTGLPPSRQVATVISRTRFDAHLEATSPGDAAARVENLKELVSAVSAYDGVDEGMRAFLDRTALLSDADSARGTSGVSLMTLHAAKGLEFPVVFITGLEEDLFPHARSAEEHEDLEEERRLLYVGMTRACKRLILSRALTRRVFGESRPAGPSRFLREVPDGVLREDDGDDARVYRPAFSGRRGRGAAGSQTTRQTVGGATGDDYSQVAPDEGASGGSRGGYTLGCKVHHPEYGVGTVIGVEGRGDTTKLTVSFSIYGSKKFLPRFAPLERI